MALPELPANFPLSHSAQVLQAKSNLDHIFAHASQALQTQSEVSCLRFHFNAVAKDAVPILHGLEALASQYDRLLPWIVDCTACFGTLLQQLDDAQKIAVGQ